MVNEDINFALSQKDFIGKLATNSGSVKGFTWCYYLPKEKFPFLKNLEAIYVDELGVENNFRRRGIGSKLTNLLITDAKKFGYRIVTLRTDVNGVAYPFYLNFGFKDMKIRDPQYSERTYMKKTI